MNNIMKHKTRYRIAIPLLIVNLFIPVYTLFTYPTWLVSVGPLLSYLYFLVAIVYLVFSAILLLVVSVMFAEAKREAIDNTYSSDSNIGITVADADDFTSAMRQIAISSKEQMLGRKLSDDEKAKIPKLKQ